MLACGEVLKIKFWGEDLMHYWKRRWICLI